MLQSIWQTCYMLITTMNTSFEKMCKEHIYYTIQIRNTKAKNVFLNVLKDYSWNLIKFSDYQVGKNI